MRKNKAYIALGSNLQNPVLQITTAISHIQQIQKTDLIATSPYYQNPPMGPQDQDDFVNAVVKLASDLSVKELLYALQQIEQSMGRVRITHWGPRIIDLDLLLYNDLVYQDAELTIPHPGIYDRIFFLKPLNDIEPELLLPNQISTQHLLQKVQLAHPNIKCEPVTTSNNDHD